MLTLSALGITVETKKILSDVTFDIAPGTVCAIMGTNGSGKSTLLKTIMGDPHYTVSAGTISLYNTLINNLPPHERARLGIFYAPQSPLAIPGVTVRQLLRAAIPREKCDSTSLLSRITEVAEVLQIPDELLSRSLNENFSGGERKKMEILQMAILEPRLILLDEIDTGVDIDALKIIGKFLRDFLRNDPQKSLLIVTHHNHILSELSAQQIHMMHKGRIVRSGDAKLAREIEENGYDF